MCVEVLDKAVGILDRDLGESPISMENVEKITLGGFFGEKIA